ncbi:hypothetical protein PNOK_0393300 [Pyrrhoderma noxium]|uniref:Uncharacterized protein n=1 Tax=Pyrrhoderma noxium TaxID=2282107 RepID=A0A286UNY0_9AGAM|nr:hypothetical protein PNOK_0393300 [Pyrrhoderma noxium]
MFIHKSKYLRDCYLTMYCLCPDTEYKRASSGDSYINTNSQSKTLHTLLNLNPPRASLQILSTLLLRLKHIISRHLLLEISHISLEPLAQLSAATAVAVANILRDVRLTLSL